MANTLKIEGKQVGRRRPLFEDWSIAIPADWMTAGPTLQDLITHVVLSEVDAFRDRQTANRLQKVLSVSQIESGLSQGKVISGDRDLDQSVDPQAAVANAIQAFQDGLYYVFLDDVQQEKLETPVALRSDSRLMFLRLVALVGG
jgi:hypothetical protein